MSNHVPHASKLIDAYINKAPDFARPICKKLRAIILKADRDIIEDWKWGPNYYKNGMVCNFGAFKQHVGLAFFQGASMKDPKKYFLREPVAAKSMRRINFTSVGEVDEKIIAAYVKEAVAVNAKGITGKKATDKTIHVPKDLNRLFAKNKNAKAFFDGLSYTNRKEYVRWIETAKKEETRNTRLTKTVSMLARGVQHP